MAGFERFQEKYFAGDDSVYSRLRQGQNPRALVISCCDSRADPGMLMGAGPGDIFVVRNVANLVPPYRDGAEMPGIRADIEFAVKGLNVEQIIILGHSSCGGIRALMDGEGITEHHYEFIGTWVSIARAARERVLRELAGESQAVQARACERRAISLSLDNLMSFPADSRAGWRRGHWRYMVGTSISTPGSCWRTLHCYFDLRSIGAEARRCGR